MGGPVLRYTNSVLDFDGVVSLYRAADILYVASRVDDRGVLVLSEFAGAAAELGEAVLVNPNDTDDLKDAFLRAIAMRPAEQSRRMKAMRKRLRVHDGRAWGLFVHHRPRRRLPTGLMDDDEGSDASWPMVLSSEPCSSPTDAVTRAAGR
jgi:trehalose-6-phosphate synthase